MAEQAGMESGQGGVRDSAWYPLRKWWQPSWLLSQDSGLTLFPDQGGSRWVDCVQRTSARPYWPEYLPPPLLVPSVTWSINQPGSETFKDQYRWRVSLDMVHFAPSEISISTGEGYLEVGGKHKERLDEHGFIARCFTRKYRLPVGIDVTRITSILSGDGILSVEAPLLQSSVPTDVIIPIQVEKDQGGGAEAEGGDHHPSSPGAPEDAEHPAVELHTETPDHGEASLPVAPVGAEVPPAGTKAEPQQHEEGVDQGAEAHGESRPAAAAVGEDTEGLPEPLDPREAPVASESGGEAKSVQKFRDIQPPQGSGDAAKELPQPEELDLGGDPPRQGLSREPDALGAEEDCAQ